LIIGGTKETPANLVVTCGTGEQNKTPPFSPTTHQSRNYQQKGASNMKWALFMFVLIVAGLFEKYLGMPWERTILCVLLCNSIENSLKD
jgi:hypothetical protein